MPTTTERRDATAAVAVPAARRPADDRPTERAASAVATARDWVDRVQERRGVGMTGPAAVLLGIAVMAPGVVADLWGSGALGAGSAVTFVVASGLAALLVRRSAMLTAVLLPPLLFAGAATVLAWTAGRTEGTRQLVLEVATSLALSAPALFLGTALAVLVVLGRLVARLGRR